MKEHEIIRKAGFKTNRSNSKYPLYIHKSCFDILNILSHKNTEEGLGNEKMRNKVKLSKEPFNKYLK